MLPHNAQLVVAAGQVLRLSQNGDVKNVATTLRPNQAKELRALQDFGRARGYDTSRPDARQQDDAELLHTTVGRLGTPATPRFTASTVDRDFIDFVITNYEGSLVMSRAVRKHGEDSALAELSRARIKEYNQELERLRRLRDSL